MIPSDDTSEAVYADRNGIAPDEKIKEVGQVSLQGAPKIILSLTRSHQRLEDRRSITRLYARVGMNVTLATPCANVSNMVAGLQIPTNSEIQDVSDEAEEQRPQTLNVNFWIVIVCSSKSFSEHQHVSCTVLYVAWPASQPQLPPLPQTPQPGQGRKCKVGSASKYLNKISSNQGGTPCPSRLAVHIHRTFA